jgi:hypothetical protein
MDLWGETKQYSRKQTTAAIQWRSEQRRQSKVVIGLDLERDLRAEDYKEMSSIFADQ